MSDETPSAREQEEAEALARALEGEALGKAPEDALEIAALLRYARGEDVPDAGRLARASTAATRAKVVPLHKRKGPLVAVLSAAAAVLLAVVSVRQASESASEVSLSAPRSPQAAQSSLQRLLAVQGEVLAAPGAPLGELASATADHRRDLLARMHERYGSAP